MNKINIECRCRFWCDDIEFNIETRKAKILCKRNWCDFVIVSKKKNNFNTDFLSKYRTKIIWNLKNWFEILTRDVINFIINAEKVWRICLTNKCNFWTFSKIKDELDTDMKLSTLKILSKNWLIFWLEYWCYHWKKKKWSICKINRWIFKSILESIWWYQCWCNEKEFHRYDDSRRDF